MHFSMAHFAPQGRGLYVIFRKKWKMLYWMVIIAVTKWVVFLHNEELIFWYEILTQPDEVNGILKFHAFFVHFARFDLALPGLGKCRTIKIHF